MSKKRNKKKSVGIRTKYNWSEKLFQKESDLSLSFFRICFGVVLIVSTNTLWDNLELNYINQFFAYKYQGFEWVTLATENWLRLILASMFVSAALILLGIFIRFASLIFLIGYTYFFLLDASYYNNHYHIIILLAILFLVTNGGKSLSIRSFFIRSPIIEKSERWKRWIFQIQIFIVYFFGGLTKLNYDWLSGGTMACILTAGADFHDKGSFFQSDVAVYLYTWAGLIFDLVVGFLLLWRPTKLWAIPAILAFNILNAFYFKIGVFPYMMIAATILFFDERDFNKIKRLFRINTRTFEHQADADFRTGKYVYTFLLTYLMIQLILPIRHHFIKGNVDWTGEGKKFAWRMKQPCKIPEKFVLNFGHPDPDVEIGLNFRLNTSQMNELLYYPEHIVQLRNYLLGRVDKSIRNEIVFYPEISVSMNSRRAKTIYDIKRYNFKEVVDKRGGHNEWITDIN